MAKQQTNPIGKKQMPHNIPQQVKSFVICPVWQLGQFPCCITATLGAFNSFWVVMAGGLLIVLEKRLVIFVFENLFQMSITIFPNLYSLQFNISAYLIEASARKESI